MPKNNNPAVPGSHTFVDPDASSEDNRKIAQDPATHLAVKRGKLILMTFKINMTQLGMTPMCMVGWIRSDNLLEQKE